MPASEYREVLAWLYSLEAARGMDFKLERVALALKRLGDPQHRFAAVHVAGTNGKGSVAAMLHAMLTAAGYRVGLYTSPHLLSFSERMRIGGASIADAEVVALAHEIRAAATIHGIDLTFFEFVTVMSFLYFARHGVDLAVVEVGLGGRLDATNVLDPEVSVITTIALDHQEYLGNTVVAVAREKAGIIKPGRPVIIGRMSPPVAALFAATAAQHHAPLYEAGRDFSVSASTPFVFAGLGQRIAGLSVALRGSYQRENAAIAIAAALRLGHKFPIGAAAVQRGLSAVCWPGRLDVVQRDPVVILDGAHNIEAMRALVRELPELLGARKLHVLFGVMRDKSWEPMVDTLGPLAASATVTTVQPPRGEGAETLAAAFARHCPVHIVEQPVDAIAAALSRLDASEALLVTGSLFLVGAVYPSFLQGHGDQGLFPAGSAAQQP